MLLSSGTTTEGTSASKLLTEFAQWVPQSIETNLGGAASQPTCAGLSNFTRLRQASGGIEIRTRAIGR